MIESTHSSGAYGSKIIGSGGGGCIVTLCEKKMYLTSLKI